MVEHRDRHDILPADRVVGSLPGERRTAGAEEDAQAGNDGERFHTSLPFKGHTRNSRAIPEMHDETGALISPLSQRGLALRLIGGDAQAHAVAEQIRQRSAVGVNVVRAFHEHGCEGYHWLTSLVVQVLA